MLAKAEKGLTNIQAKFQLNFVLKKKIVHLHNILCKKLFYAKKLMTFGKMTVRYCTVRFRIVCIVVKMTFYGFLDKILYIKENLQGTYRQVIAEIFFGLVNILTQLYRLYGTGIWLCQQNAVRYRYRYLQCSKKKF